MLVEFDKRHRQSMAEAGVESGMPTRKARGGERSRERVVRRSVPPRARRTLRVGAEHRGSDARRRRACAPDELENEIDARWSRGSGRFDGARERRSRFAWCAAIRTPSARASSERGGTKSGGGERRGWIRARHRGGRGRSRRRGGGGCGGGGARVARFPSSAEAGEYDLSIFAVEAEASVVGRHAARSSPRRAAQGSSGGCAGGYRPVRGVFVGRQGTPRRDDLVGAAGREATVTIEARDAFGNPAAFSDERLRVDAVGPADVAFAPSGASAAERRFAGALVKSGSYTLRVAVGGRNVAGTLETSRLWPR